MTYEEFKALRKTVETVHGTFTYAEHGEGPVALFVHGLFVSDCVWHGAIEDLSGERRCMAYCLPWHAGGVVADDQPLDLDAQVDMLEGFCDALGLDGFDLVANDTGGAVAQGLVVRNPARLRSLALTNCEAKDWMPSKNELGKLVDQLAAEGNLAPMMHSFHQDFANVRQSVFAATMQWPDRISDDDLHGIMEPHQATLEGARRLERFAQSLEAADLSALEPRLRELEVPTIAVWGTADEVFPVELATWLRDTIPGCEEVVEIDGGKLFWPFERGDELVPHLRRHWAAKAPAS
jgi:pimeloyl-ACP methyl ester carboxylesterase